MYGKRMKKNKGKEVLGKAMRIKAAVDTGGMSEVVRGAKNVLGKPGQERRQARRAARKAKRAAKYGGGRAMYGKGGMSMEGSQPKYNGMPKCMPN
tara:strand:+ start:141 stop:425 length:285 start_codon:yes stop_codon:yes gene_type:complete